MGDETQIEWCDRTFNPWEGCTKISPACDNCYAEKVVNRFRNVPWGNNPRRRTSVSNWNKPHKWERAAAKFYEKHGRRQRVFCASLADVFDNQVDTEWRDDLWKVIRETPSLDWLLLTKRPQNIDRMKPSYWDEVKGHVWLGATGENQEQYDRAHKYLSQQDSVVIFVSIEPMLGPIDTYRGGFDTLRQMRSPQGKIYRPFDWLIVGGESGHGARPLNPKWIYELRDQAYAAGVAFLFKQWGAWAPYHHVSVEEGIKFTEKGKSHRVHIAYDGTTGGDPHIPGCSTMYKLGKGRAGRLLGGKEYNGFPT